MIHSASVSRVHVAFPKHS